MYVCLKQINGILAAVDATKQPELASRFGVKGYPTLKYFSKGEFKFDAGHARQEEQIISFIKVSRNNCSLYSSSPSLSF